MSSWLPTLSLSSDNNVAVIAAGSSRGLGFCMAQEFLALGDRVVVCGRSSESVNKAVTELSATVTGSEGSIMGVPVDVCDSAQVHAVADKTVARFGKVDLWINNAALSVAQTGPMEDLSPEELHRIVNTNLLGVMYGFQAAMRVMTPLKSGRIINISGAGFNGWATPNFAPYGATKAAMAQLTKSLARETRASGCGVAVDCAGPGMMLTDLLLSGEKSKSVYKIFNILAERPETPAAWLVPRIRGASGSGGSHINYLTIPSVLFRFLTAPFRRNRHIDEATGELKYSAGLAAPGTAKKQQ